MNAWYKHREWWMCPCDCRLHCSLYDWSVSSGWSVEREASSIRPNVHRLAWPSGRKNALLQGPVSGSLWKTDGVINISLQDNQWYPPLTPKPFCIWFDHASNTIMHFKINLEDMPSPFPCVSASVLSLSTSLCLSLCMSVCLSVGLSQFNLSISLWRGIPLSRDLSTIRRR